MSQATIQILNAEIQAELTLPPRYVDEHFQIVASIVAAKAPSKKCSCVGCRPVDPNPNGCINETRRDAYQYVTATSF
jgi:hypothetical protein